MDFQTRLTNIRRSKGFTQKQVADGIGISEVGLQNYENGRRKPAFDVLIALADFLYFTASRPRAAYAVDHHRARPILLCHCFVKQV